MYRFKKFFLFLTLLIVAHNSFAYDEVAERRQLIFEMVKGVALVPVMVFGFAIIIAGGFSYWEIKYLMKNQDEKEEKSFSALFWKTYLKYLKGILCNVQLPLFCSASLPFFITPYCPPPPVVTYRPAIQTYTPVYMPPPLIIIR